jgi:hypothetical protein
MNFLTPEQRAKAIESLAKAPDEILLTLMVELRKLAHIEEGMRRNVTELFVERRVAIVPVADEKRGAITAVVEKVDEIVVPPVTRKNVCPGPVSTSKIGLKTVDYVLNELKAGDREPIYFGTKNLENLKLMWSRKAIKFDGKVYYL